MQDMTAVGLLERKHELRQLDRLVEDAHDRRGRMVLVEGAPGIGKTRLLDAGRDRARETDMVVLSARASELDREFPFGVVRQLFEPLVSGADRGRREELLHGAAGLAAPLLGQGSPGHELTSGGPDASLTLFHALYWLTSNLSDAAPVLLAIDDLHWADVSSLRFLQFVLPRLEELPVLVAVATRTTETGGDTQAIDALATDPHTLVLRPRPLSDDAVAELVASELGDQADAVFSDACHEATGGNPFLVRELLRELTAEGVSPGSDEVPLVRQLAPPTVARAVLLRLARLGDDASALAHAVAVLGDGAPMRRACALAGLAEDRGGELAGSLAQAGILAPARPLAFAHPILRSAVYADMDAGQRAQSHGRAADLLSSEGAGADAVAVQLLASEPAANPHVAASLREGAAHALARGAPRTAVACLERALAEPPPADQRGPVLLELASAEFVGGEPSAAAHHFEEAFSIASDPRSRAEYARDRGLALQAIGRHEEAFAVRERAVDEVEHVDPALARLLEVSLVASARFDLRRLAWAIERLERRPAGPVSDTPAEHGLLAMQAHVAAFSPESGRSAEALADSLEAAVASDKLLTAGLATPFFSAVDLLILADRTDLARRALDRSVEEARRGGSALRFAFSSGVRSLLLARSGALAEAEADARACAELALPQGWFVLGPVILGLVLDTLIERGELQEAGRLLARSGMGDRPADHDLTFDPVVHARARLRAAQGDVAGGRADLGSLARRRARWNTYPSLVPAVLAAPELADGDPDEVRASAQRMVSEAERWGTSRAIGMALRAAGLLETEAQGLELLEQAVTVLESSPAPLEYARALADFGAALRRANRRADARDPLRRALDLADACGAKPLGDRARQELRAAGGRPRRPRTSGAESLTASERRIATMAAEGLSNPEIAQALFVTRKTVEAHLGNAYRKLDISSRTQLGQALRTGSGDLP